MYQNIVVNESFLFYRFKNVNNQFKLLKLKEGLPLFIYLIMNAI